MSLVVPFVTYFSTGVAFGGARPVSINPLNFRNPPLGFALSAGVGPVSNFVLAGGGFGLLWLLWTVAPSFVYSANSDTVTYNGLFLGIFITLNVGLGAFNLLPLPGLDGSRLLWYLLPPRGREVLDRMEPFAMGITYLLILIGATRVLWPATVGAWMAIFAVFGGDFGNALLHAVFRR
jgi:Zn-dependent protease